MIVLSTIIGTATVWPEPGARNSNLLPVKANLALSLFSSGHAGEAESLYREIVGLSPESAEAHSNLAHVLNEQQRYGEAEPHARKAVELAPNAAASQDILGNALYGLGRMAEAEEVDADGDGVPDAFDPHSADS